MASLGISCTDIRRRIDTVIGRSESFPRRHMPFTANGKAILENSLAEAQRFGHDEVTTEHMLLAAAASEGRSGRILLAAGLGGKQLRELLSRRWGQ